MYEPFQTFELYCKNSKIYSYYRLLLGLFLRDLELFFPFRLRPRVGAFGSGCRPDHGSGRATVGCSGGSTNAVLLVRDLGFPATTSKRIGVNCCEEADRGKLAGRAERELEEREGE